jgi:hypothetical protein
VWTSRLQRIQPAVTTSSAVGAESGTIAIMSGATQLTWSEEPDSAGLTSRTRHAARASRTGAIIQAAFIAFMRIRQAAEDLRVPA